MKMLCKKLCSVKKLAKKVKAISVNNNANNTQPPHYECLLGDDYGGRGGSMRTPTGTFPVYVGEYRERFVVPTSHLSHPLFKIMLEKAYDEYGFEQRNGLVVPCSVAAFQEVISAVECCNGKFHFGDLVEEFL